MRVIIYLILLNLTFSFSIFNYLFIYSNSTSEFISSLIPNIDLKFERNLVFREKRFSRSVNSEERNQGEKRNYSLAFQTETWKGANRRM